MDGLIILLILIPFVFLILLISVHSRSGEQKRFLESMHDDVKDLKNEIAELRKQLNPLKKGSVTSTAPTTKKEIAQEEIIVPPVVIAEEEIETPPVTHYVQPEEIIIPKGVIERIVEKTQEDEHYTPVPPKEKKDLEKFIGENIANKIGIAVLVLGISFFVKYAIDKNWINETGRVIIGFIAGGILIGIAHKIRNNYRSFSSVLAGGGLAVFYFTVAFAFHQYQLITQTTAFISMVVISIFAVLLSLVYKRQELAILAVIGAFITPFLVSTGKENYIALFTYLCIINAACIVLSWFKRWPAINIIALFFTTIIFGGWILKHSIFDDSSTLPYKDGFLFATLFYILFVAMNIINAVRLRKQFTAFDFILVLCTNFLYYAAGMVLLSYFSNKNYPGLFTLLLGVFNLTLAYTFNKRKNTDKNFIALLTGISISFVSLAAPVHLKGNHIVIFWAAESVVLYWLYLRTRFQLLKTSSFFVTVLMIGSLLLLWDHNYLDNTTLIPVLLNKGFITSLVASIALLLLYKLAAKDENDNSLYRRLLPTTVIVVVYCTGALETYYQFTTRYPDTYIAIVYLQLFTFLIVAGLLWFFKKDKNYYILKLVLTILCFLFYAFSIPATNAVSNLLSTKGPAALFIAHWINAALLLWLLYDVILVFSTNKVDNWKAMRKPVSWIMAFAVIFIFSVELYQLFLWFNYRDTNNWPWWQNLYNKAGLSILWGFCSFAMMWIGMKKNYQPLRIISLTLFTITLVKLFLYDIQNMPAGSKIAAFILLGVLLLAVSFMYQRLKKIIIENKEE